MNGSIETLTNQLKNTGIRPSYHRIKVLEYLLQKGGHPTVDEIYRALSPEIPSLSKVTVYNTVHMLLKVHLIRVVDIDDTEKRYDITLANHGHFQCEVCGTIYNFEVDMEQIISQELNQFKITQKNVYFKGICPACSKQT
jgi:Fur family transcriptional regulator, peroxide stress response regulator